MKVICVCGQLASAKDTVSDYLADKLNERADRPMWHRIGFAHAVKQVFMDTFDTDWDFIEKWKRRDEIPEGFQMPIRKALQFIGDGFRQIKADIWIETALRNARFTRPGAACHDAKVISDGRYINEMKAVKEHGGINILLWRKNFENDDPNPSESQIKPIVDWFVKSGLEGDVRAKLKSELFVGVEGLVDVKGFVDGHFETFLTKGAIPEEAKLFDFFIRNEGNLDQLYQKLDEVVIPRIEEYYGTSNGTSCK